MSKQMSPEDAKAWLQTKAGLAYHLDKSTKGLKGTARRQAQQKHDEKAAKDCPRLVMISKGLKVMW